MSRVIKPGTDFLVDLKAYRTSTALSRRRLSLSLSSSLSLSNPISKFILGQVWAQASPLGERRALRAAVGRRRYPSGHGAFARASPVVGAVMMPRPPYHVDGAVMMFVSAGRCIARQGKMENGLGHRWIVTSLQARAGFPRPWGHEHATYGYRRRAGAARKPTWTRLSTGLTVDSQPSGRDSSPWARAAESPTCSCVPPRASVELSACHSFSTFSFLHHTT